MEPKALRSVNLRLWPFVLIVTRAIPMKDITMPTYPPLQIFSFKVIVASNATKIVLDATRIELADAGISRRAEKLKFGYRKKIIAPDNSERASPLPRISQSLWLFLVSNNPRAIAVAANVELKKLSWGGLSSLRISLPIGWPDPQTNVARIRSAYSLCFKVQYGLHVST